MGRPDGIGRAALDRRQVGDVGEQIGLRPALIGLPAALAIAAPPPSAWAQPALRCGPFTQEALPPPAPRDNIHARDRFEQIKAAVRTQPYKVLFLGDSLTERFDEQ